MANWWSRLFGRRNNRGDTPAQDDAPQPSQPPAPAAAGSPPSAAPTIPPDTLAQAQQAAQALLGDARMVAMLPTEVLDALRGLLAPQPTAAQAQQGMAALAAVGAAMAADTDDTEEAGQPLTLDQARQLARRFLADPQVAPRLSPEIERDLRGLLSPEPTEEQLTEGSQALAAVMDALGGQRVSLTREQAERINALLLEWIKTPDWSASRAYLQEHADTLLTDGAEAVLDMLRQAQQSDGARQTIADHQRLLRDARANGVAAAYDAFLHDRRPQAGSQLTPDAEINALLAELGDVDTDREPARAATLCRRILALDERRHALTTQVRAAVLGTLANALQERAGRLGGEAGLAALDEALRCYDLALLEYRREVAPLNWAATQNNKANALKERAGRLGGEAGLAALDEALRCYDLALLERRREVAPLDWAMTQNNKANALQERAGRLGGEAGLAALDEALRCYDLALLEYRREVAPLNWAATQNNKASALKERAGRLGGEAGLAALDEALRCYDLALLEYRREVAPLNWAATQNNKANALQERAGRLGGEAGLAALDEALRCYDLALLEYRREVAPLDWAATQNNKANALQERAGRLGGEAGLAALDEALRCYDLALLEYRREVAPLDWAATQNNKANALQERAGRLGGEAGLAALDEALRCYDLALLEYRREVAPLDWAMTQNNKASALKERAGRLGGEAGLAALDEALRCYDLALLEYRREVAPLNWAATQNNKANALKERAGRLGGEAGLAALDEALRCYDLALLEYRREVAPLDWAMTQNNKASALQERAGRLGGEAGLAALDEALRCYDLALLEYRREVAPLNWAATQNNKASALKERAGRLGGEAGLAALDEALRCYDLALLERRREVAPLDWAMTQNNKANALKERAGRLGGEAGLAALDEALRCYDLALLERRREVAPLDWAMTQNNKASALKERAGRLGGEAGLAALDEALRCYDLALLERRREVAPLNWAATQNNKASALQERAGRLGGEAGLAALDEALRCYDLALLEYRREVAPLNWAATQNNKANALQERAGRLGGEAGLAALDEALRCYDLALLEYRREVAPLDWAMTQNNKASALQERAGRLGGEAGLAALDEALRCYDLALLERRREVAPLDWAATQNNKANALKERAGRLGGEAGLAALDEALRCYDLALLEYRREVAPLDWAMTQNNKASALQERAGRLGGEAGLAALDEALRCYDLALLEYRREVAPLNWAATQNNKASALKERAGRLGGEAGLAALDEALRCYDLALLERRREVAPLDWAMTQNNKANALKERAGRLGGEAGLAALDEALRCYDLALTMYPLAVQPDEHRRHARVLASALLRRALAPESAGAARVEALDRAWAVISSALQAARDLALREALLSFRQHEWAENARVFTLAAAITALRGAEETDGAAAATQRERLAEAIALLEEGRARGLAEAAGRRDADLAALAPADQRGYRAAVAAVQEIEAQSRQAQHPLALAEEARAADARLKQVVTEIRRTRRAQGGDFLPEPDTSLPTLARALGQRETLVYLMPLEVGTLLLAFTAAGEPVMRWLGSLTSDAIFALAVQPNARGVNLCGYLPAALGWGETPLDQALDTLLPRLGDDLMREVVAVARGLGCHRATLVAGGFLAVLPLHAASYAPLAGEPASAPGGRRYACDDLAITFAPSALTLLAARSAAQRRAQAGPARRALVVGNPQLTRQGEPWAPGSPYYLRFAEWEAQRVAALASGRAPAWQVDLAVNATATWSAVRDGLRDVDLAHLSLHAQFDSANPERSALLVAFRSHLSLRDLLDTRAGALDRLRLIVLSACQSAQSDVQNQSEEAIGLFGALLAAGAPAVVGTLWSVDDLATAHFMESFARRAYQQGAAPDAALRAAARELRGVGDDVASPAETGAVYSVRWSVEEVAPEQPRSTPAREAIAQDLQAAELEPALAGATREMSLPEWQETQQALADYRRHLLKKRGAEHPMYWAAFVYYGAPVSLAGDAAQVDAAPPHTAWADPAPHTGGARMSDQRDDPQRSLPSSDDERDGERDGAEDADDALPIATTRAASYFPAASDVCPRCLGEDYLPVSDARGRDVRQCVSCGLRYAVGDE